jgi:hypothetical protein
MRQLPVHQRATPRAKHDKLVHGSKGEDVVHRLELSGYNSVVMRALSAMICYGRCFQMKVHAHDLSCVYESNYLPAKCLCQLPTGSLDLVPLTHDRQLDVLRLRGGGRSQVVTSECPIQYMMASGESNEPFHTPDDILRHGIQGSFQFFR